MNYVDSDANVFLLLDVKGDCGNGYARCGDLNSCIPANTWCDGFNNCGKGDRSDESSCNKDNGHQWAPIGKHKAEYILYIE